MFTLHMTTGNAAFRDEVTGELDAYMESFEIARILGVVRTQLRNGYKHGPCLDINGNKVGEWSLD